MNDKVVELLNPRVESTHLEEPQHGQEERNHERHREVCKRMTTDHRSDRLEERRQSPLAWCAIKYHSANLPEKFHPHALASILA